MSTEATCPLCGSDLYLIRHFSIPVINTTEDWTGVDFAVMDRWDVECENGHRLDSGRPEMDGRSARLGYRSALGLGGLR